VEGQLIGDRYLIERFIAAGTMGEVYRARHHVTQKVVAVKLLFPHLTRRETDVIRFEREARLAASLDHPNIIKVFDAGRHEGRYYLAMEYLEGHTLEDLIEGGDGTRAAFLTHFASALGGLGAAHAAGIIHRDVKPANILLTHSENGPMGVKLLDFGIARQAGGVSATQTGMTIGTPVYMSPEQATRPEQVGPASDVWSAGIILYELLTGRRPFAAQSPTALLVKVVSESHAPVLHWAPKAPRALAEITERCLIKDPAARYADATALLVAVKAVLTDPGVVEWMGAGHGTVVRLGLDTEDVSAVSVDGGPVDDTFGSLVWKRRGPGLYVAVLGLLLAGAIYLGLAALDESTVPPVEADGTVPTAVKTPAPKTTDAAAPTAVPLATGSAKGVPDGGREVSDTSVPKASNPGSARRSKAGKKVRSASAAKRIRRTRRVEQTPRPKDAGVAATATPETIGERVKRSPVMEQKDATVPHPVALPVEPVVPAVPKKPAEVPVVKTPKSSADSEGDDEEIPLTF